MPKSRLRNKVARVIQEPIAFEMAEWFYGNSKQDILVHSQIANQIQKILRHRGKWKSGDKVPQQMYSNVINDTRTYMIGMYKLTLANIKQTKTYEGGYKVANEAEATHIGEQRLRRFGLAGRRAIEMIPLMKREHLSRPIREIFAETINGIKDVKTSYERYLIAYDNGEKERKAVEKELTKQEAK